MNWKWGSQELPEEGLSINSNDLTLLRIKRVNEEILIAPGPVDDDTVFSRFIAGREAKIVLYPALPELPIVIKPQMPLSILPGLTFHCFVEVPLVFSISNVKGKKQELLTEVSVHNLSRSWFGDPWNGEVSYCLESPLNTDIEKYDQTETSIYCPVHIVNRSSQILALDRMLLRVPYLSVYQGRKRLYSNGTKISFRGQDQISQVTFYKGPPELEGSLKQITPPRQTDESGLLTKSFYFFKTIYNG
ncbi:DUF432 domain-containing protein [Spirochaeta isovalerica]|uniref:DUF432 domain-containing protein n=1 Tax=Spirochaeta isovalerica TaxID=150 RepID=A0A841RBH8_9SPIO|nr:DUF432 domain-containing protein [Spirochaeta isovalerica]MBB6481325.1 hypothetical protein [Spirochaeta isovalerica]